MSDEIKILVCAHKPSDFPNSDIYLPIQAGKAISDIDLGITGDDTGDNISIKNQSYCELTALYWAWKNIKKLYPNLKYIGLCHYRRYFSFNKFLYKAPYIYKSSVSDIKTDDEFIIKLLKKYDCLLPVKDTFPISVADNYRLFHYSEDYNILKSIINEKQPEYDIDFNIITESNNRLSIGNMFISNYDFLDAYCKWVFPILSELENNISVDNRNAYQKRVFGFMAERLLNVFVHHNKCSCFYLPIIMIGIKENYIEQLCKTKRYNRSFYLQTHQSFVEYLLVKFEHIITRFSKYGLFESIKWYYNKLRRKR